MTWLTTLLMTLLMAQPATAPADTPHAPADALAEEVMRASGSEVWPKVKRIRFVFHVEQQGKVVSSVQHDWDLRAGTDTVTWNGRTVTVDIHRTDHEGEHTKAYGRFINDTYWLLAPLKVMDPGVIRTAGEPQEIEGKPHLLLHLSFDGVGLTPSDQYNLWIDPTTKLVRFWDFIPAGGKPRRFTWEGYQDFNGLNLSTRHVVEGGGSAIAFTDIEVDL
jgi:hypothetical protein